MKTFLIKMVVPSTTIESIEIKANNLDEAIAAYKKGGSHILLEKTTITHFIDTEVTKIEIIED
jgi:hypothetical protein